MFTVQDNSRCEGMTYKIVDIDGNEFSSNDEEFDRFGLSNNAPNFEIETTVLPTGGTVITIPYELNIKAIADGGAFTLQRVDAVIVVCGYEELESIIDRNKLAVFERIVYINYEPDLINLK